MVENKVIIRDVKVGARAKLDGIALDVRKQLTEIIEQEGQIAKDLVGTFHDLSEIVVADYFAFVDKRPVDELDTATHTLFARVNKNGREIGQLESTLDAYKSWIQEASHHPTVEQILDDDLDYESLKDKVTALQQDALPDIGETLGWHFFEKGVIEVIAEMRHFNREGGFDHLDRLVAASKEMYALGGGEATTLFLSDFAKEVIERDKLDLPDEEMIEELRESPTKVGYHFCAYGHETTPLLDELLTAKKSYAKLGDKQYMKIFSSIPLALSTRSSFVQSVTEHIDTLVSEGVKLKSVARLIGTAADVDRFDLLEYLTRRPQAVRVHESIRGTDITDDEYIDFLATTANTEVNGRVLLDVIDDILAKKSQKDVAAHFIREGVDLLSDERREEIVAIAKSYSLAHIILQDYQTALAENQPNKAALALHLGRAIPTPSRLKALRQHISGLEEEDLDWVQGDLSDVDLKRQLQNGKKQEAVTQRTEKKNVDWYTTMMRSLEKAGVTESERRAIDEARHILPSELSNQLRSVWHTVPEYLGRFAEHVRAYGSTEGYQQLLSTSNLFRAYRDRLGEKGLGEKLGKVVENGSSNIYRDLRALLIPETHLTEEKEERQEKTIETNGNIEYERIIIWGGQYSPKGKDVIRAALPDTPIEIIDINAQRRDPSAIQKGDLVVCVTGSMNHPLYHTIRNRCKNHGHPFRHFKKTGAKSLADYLRRLK